MLFRNWRVTTFPAKLFLAAVAISVLLTIVWYIYESSFVNFRMGYASATSCALFVILAVVTMVQMRILRSNQSDLE